jgi:hypothetical protein
LISSVVTPSASSARARGSDCASSSSSSGGAGGAHGGDDAAAGARDVLVAGALQALLELAGAVAGEHQVGVAVDQARA